MWLLFAVPVMAICVCFFIFYLTQIYPKRRPEQNRRNEQTDALNIEEAQASDSWLEMELMGLTEDDENLRLQEAHLSEEGFEAVDSHSEGDVNKETEAKSLGLREPAKSFHKPFPLKKHDLIPILLITAVYAVVALWGLGSRDTPKSFAVFKEIREEARLELPSGSTPDKLMLFTGIGTGNYEIDASTGNGEWFKISIFNQKYSELLKWHEIDFPEYTGKVKYLRITSESRNMYLGEVVVFDAKGNRIPMKGNDVISASLIDEPELPAISTSYLYNSYFDEIYHARTAYEHNENIYPYEVSHPPLGKLTIGLGIRLFGMNAFGWRFMGTIFGILMLPIIYIFIKNMFGKVLVASCGTLLFAFDFMHFVQTRIATIDTYGVFYILLMFYFMYRYLTQDYDTPFLKTLLPLFLSGLFFGIGSASKWTVVYGGAGLLAVYVIRQILRGRYYKKIGKIENYYKYLAGTLLVSILFFVIIPAMVYVLSYIPYGTAKGMSVSEGMLWNPEFLKIVWENQEFMLSYHGKLVAEHPYSSPWWMWIINLRPILYYLQSFTDGTKSAFAAFGNPVVWWTGIAAIISLVLAVIKRRDKLALFILIGYLVQLLPWVVISRIAFVYHYFPCVIFIVLGISYMFNDLCEKKSNKLSGAVPLLTASALLAFVAFYPVLTGIRVDAEYPNTFLRWFCGMWPF